MSDTIKGRSRGYLTFLVLFMGLVALIDQHLNLIETTAIPFIVEEFWIAPRQIQSLLSMMGIFVIGQFAFWQGIAEINTIIGAVASGFFMDKIGRNKTLTLGTIISVLMFCFLGIFSHPVFLWILFFSMSILIAWIMIYFAEIYPTDRRSTCIGITNTLSRVGYVIGPLLASVLKTAFVTTMQMYWIIGCLFMLVFLVAILMKPYETKYKTLEEIEKER